MRILFVHEVSWFNKVVFEMHDFPELLSLRGHEVHFLDFDEGKARAKRRVLTTIETRAHAGSRVAVTTPPRGLPGILGRLLATIVQPLVFLLLVRRIRPDAVVVYSVPTSGWQITAICRWKKIPVVARVIDIPHVLRKTRFQVLVKWAERYVFSNATVVSTHNEVLRQYCLGLGALSAKTSIIYPGIDTKRFYPAPPRIDLQRRLGIQPSDKVIVFMGTLFRFSGLSELITELAPALRNDPSLTFLIFGDGEEFGRLQQLVHSLGMSKQVLLTGRIEYEQLADYIRLGQVAVVPFRAELVTHGALPGKVLQYLACGLPTIATPLHGLQSMVTEGEGVYYADGAEDMTRKALQLVSSQEQRGDVASRGLRLINQHCDWETQIQKFEQLLGSLINDQ